MNYIETESEVFFYGHKNGKFAPFSNFYTCHFTNELGGFVFNCSEQYFMYGKCLLFNPDNADLLNKILNEKSPTKIKKYGRMVKNFNQDVWATHRYEIMKTALLLKFSQNPDIKILLLQTAGKQLYEASKWDRIWGIGYFCGQVKPDTYTKFGLNLLGKCLMDVRETLSN